MDSHLKLVLQGDPEELLLLLVRLQKPGIAPPWCRTITQFGDIIACRVQRKHLLYVYNSPLTFSIKAPRLIPAPLKEAVADGLDSPFQSVHPSRQMGTPYSGKDVCFAAVDWGFDFAHANLRKPDGTTRFAYIWDQNGIYDGNQYGFGCVYTASEINEALQSDTPYQTLGYHPGSNDVLGAGMHGTHVLDIATGTPVIGEGGVAPGVTLIGVELGSNFVNGSDLAMGDSCRLLLALDFIHSVTKTMNKPCIINMSLGSHGDSHTGRSLVEIAFDNFLQQNPGYALVQSVGNYYRANCHIHHILEQSQSYPIEWNIPRRNKAANEVEVWYNGNDELSVTLIAPDGELVAEIAPFKDIQILYRGDPIGYIFHRTKEPNTGLNHIDIILDDTVLTGKWIIELTGDKITNGSFHAYCERNDASQARFSPHQSTPYTTTGSVCNGLHTIAVGAYNHHDVQQPVVAFSSAGPTAFGQAKPDLLAPGYKIRAACSASASQYNAANGLTVKSGSSMAAPHVSGAIALLFEKYYPRRLSVSQIKTLLQASLNRLPDHYTPPDRMRAGNGILNIANLLNDKANSMNTSNYTASDLLSEGDTPPPPPGLISRETDPAAETLYVSIDLGLHKECCVRDCHNINICLQKLSYDVEAKTGIFFPSTFKAKSAIDLIIYLHGHKAGYVKNGKDLPIDRLWNKTHLPVFALREVLNETGSDSILVAPTLGPFSQPGTLTSNAGFTSFVEQVLAAIVQHSTAYKGTQTIPLIKSIVLAAHSGGGVRMRTIASLPNTNRYVGLIKECWGFDCTYASDDAKVWHNWAANNVGKNLYLYSIAGTTTAKLSAPLKQAPYNLPNIHVLPAATKDHNSVPQIHLRERLSGKAAVLPSVQPPTPPAANGNKSAGYGVLTGSVGKGGQNNTSDVQTVQTLLNKAGISIPVTGKTTGAEGDITVLAIYRYQKQKKLASYDGRIDPNGATIKSLLQQSPVQPSQPSTPATPLTPAPTEPADASIEAELTAHPFCLKWYKTAAAYKKVRDQVVSWKISDPATYIEEALQEWDAASLKTRKPFDGGFDGNPECSFLNLKRLYKLKCISNPGSYFDKNLISVSTFRKKDTTSVHKDLAAVLSKVEASLAADGHDFKFDSFGSFNPRTLRDKPDKLSNHAMGKAVDINPGSNPHIKSPGEMEVINAVCKDLLPKKLQGEADPDVLLAASAHFQQTFNSAWIAQQTDKKLIKTINANKAQLTIYAKRGFLTLPSVFIKAMIKAGLIWGGTWHSQKDFMHFELRKQTECS